MITLDDCQSVTSKDDKIEELEMRHTKDEKRIQDLISDVIDLNKAIDILRGEVGRNINNTTNILQLERELNDTKQLLREERAKNETLKDRLGLTERL